MNDRRPLPARPEQAVRSQVLGLLIGDGGGQVARRRARYHRLVAQYRALLADPDQGGPWLAGAPVAGDDPAVVGAQLLAAALPPVRQLAGTDPGPGRALAHRAARWIAHGVVAAELARTPSARTSSTGGPAPSEQGNRAADVHLFPRALAQALPGPARRALLATHRDVAAGFDAEAARHHGHGYWQRVLDADALAVLDALERLASSQAAPGGPGPAPDLAGVYLTADPAQVAGLFRAARHLPVRYFDDAGRPVPPQEVAARLEAEVDLALEARFGSRIPDADREAIRSKIGQEARQRPWKLANHGGLTAQSGRFAITVATTLHLPPGGTVPLDPVAGADVVSAARGYRREARARGVSGNRRTLSFLFPLRALRLFGVPAALLPDLAVSLPRPIWGYTLHRANRNSTSLRSRTAPDEVAAPVTCHLHAHGADEAAPLGAVPAVDTAAPPPDHGGRAVTLHVPVSMMPELRTTAPVPPETLAADPRRLVPHVPMAIHALHLDDVPTTGNALRQEILRRWNRRGNRADHRALEEFVKIAPDDDKILNWINGRGGPLTLHGTPTRHVAGDFQLRTDAVTVLSQAFPLQEWSEEVVSAGLDETAEREFGVAFGPGVRLFGDGTGSSGTSVVPDASYRRSWHSGVGATREEGIRFEGQRDHVLARVRQTLTLTEATHSQGIRLPRLGQRRDPTPTRTEIQVETLSLVPASEVTRLRSRAAGGAAQRGSTAAVAARPSAVPGPTTSVAPLPATSVAPFARLVDLREDVRALRLREDVLGAAAALRAVSRVSADTTSGWGSWSALENNRATLWQLLDPEALAADVGRRTSRLLSVPGRQGLQVDVVSRWVPDPATGTVADAPEPSPALVQGHQGTQLSTADTLGRTRSSGVLSTVAPWGTVRDIVPGIDWGSERFSVFGQAGTERRWSAGSGHDLVAGTEHRSADSPADLRLQAGHYEATVTLRRVGRSVPATLRPAGRAIGSVARRVGGRPRLPHLPGWARGTSTQVAFTRTFRVPTRLAVPESAVSEAAVVQALEPYRAWANAPREHPVRRPAAGHVPLEQVLTERGYGTRPGDADWLLTAAGVLPFTAQLDARTAELVERVVVTARGEAELAPGTPVAHVVHGTPVPSRSRGSLSQVTYTASRPGPSDEVQAAAGLRLSGAFVVPTAAVPRQHLRVFRAERVQAGSGRARGRWAGFGGRIAARPQAVPLPGDGHRHGAGLVLGAGPVGGRYTGRVQGSALAMRATVEEWLRTPPADYAWVAAQADVVVAAQGAAGRFSAEESWQGTQLYLVPADVARAHGLAIPTTPETRAAGVPIPRPTGLARGGSGESHVLDAPDLIGPAREQLLRLRGDAAFAPLVEPVHRLLAESSAADTDGTQRQALQRLLASEGVAAALRNGGAGQAWLAVERHPSTRRFSPRQLWPRTDDVRVELRVALEGDATSGPLMPGTEVRRRWTGEESTATNRGSWQRDRFGTHVTEAADALPGDTFGTWGGQYQRSQDLYSGRQTGQGDAVTSITEVRRRGTYVPLTHRVRCELVITKGDHQVAVTLAAPDGRHEATAWRGGLPHQTDVHVHRPASGTGPATVTTVRPVRPDDLTVAATARPGTSPPPDAGPGGQPVTGAWTAGPGGLPVPESFTPLAVARCDGQGSLGSQVLEQMRRYGVLGGGSPAEQKGVALPLTDTFLTANWRRICSPDGITLDLSVGRHPDDRQLRIRAIPAEGVRVVAQTQGDLLRSQVTTKTTASTGLTSDREAVRQIAPSLLPGADTARPDPDLPVGPTAGAPRSAARADSAAAGTADNNVRRSEQARLDELDVDLEYRHRLVVEVIRKGDPLLRQEALVAVVGSALPDDAAAVLGIRYDWPPGPRQQAWNQFRAAGRERTRLETAADGQAPDLGPAWLDTLRREHEARERLGVVHAPTAPDQRRRPAPVQSSPPRSGRSR